MAVYNNIFFFQIYFLRKNTICNPYTEYILTNYVTGKASGYQIGYLVINYVRVKI